MNKYIINVDKNIDSKFGEYVRTSNSLGEYETVLKAVIANYDSEDNLYKNYKLFYKFAKESNWDNIYIVLLLMLCDCVLYDKAIAEQLKNIYTFFHQVPYAYAVQVYAKILSRYNLISIHRDYIDIGKMLPDKDYLSNSFMTRFPLNYSVEPDLIVKDEVLKFRKVKSTSDKLVMYENDILGYTDVVILANRKLSYLFINKKNVEFRQISYDKQKGYSYETLSKDKIDNIERKIFGKVLFI